MAENKNLYWVICSACCARYDKKKQAEIYSISSCSCMFCESCTPNADDRCPGCTKTVTKVFKIDGSLPPHVKEMFSRNEESLAKVRKRSTFQDGQYNRSVSRMKRAIKEVYLKIQDERKKLEEQKANVCAVAARVKEREHQVERLNGALQAVELNRSLEGRRSDTQLSSQLSDVSGAASYGSQGYRVAPHDAGFRRDQDLGHQVAPHSLMYEPVTLAREDQGAHFGGTDFTARPSKQGHLGARGERIEKPERNYSHGRANNLHVRDDGPGRGDNQTRGRGVMDPFRPGNEYGRREAANTYGGPGGIDASNALMYVHAPSVARQAVGAEEASKRLYERGPRQEYQDVRRLDGHYTGTRREGPALGVIRPTQNYALQHLNTKHEATRTLNTANFNYPLLHRNQVYDQHTLGLATIQPPNQGTHHPEYNSVARHHLYPLTTAAATVAPQPRQNEGVMARNIPYSQTSQGYNII